jgi:hypothetical protein
LYYKHNEFYLKNLDNPWDFGNSFVLIFENPFVIQRKDLALSKFLEICPNYNMMFGEWSMPGKIDEKVKESRRIADFIKDELERKRNIYLFLKP